MKIGPEISNIDELILLIDWRIFRQLCI